MDILKKILCSFLFFLLYVNIKTSDDYSDEYTNEETAAMPTGEQNSTAINVYDDSVTKESPLSTKPTTIEIIKNLQEKNEKLKKEIAQRQADLQKQNKSKKEQKQNPALTAKIKNDKIAIQINRDQITRNNEQIAQLEKVKSEPSNLLGRLYSKKRKKRQPYCNPKITL